MEITNCTFNCTGKVNNNDFNITKSGTFMRDVLVRMMYANNIDSDNDNDIDNDLGNTFNVNLFGHYIPASTAVLHLEHLIKCMKMQLKILRRYETSNTQLICYSSENNELDLYMVRKSICTFIFYISLYLKRIGPEWIRPEHILIMNFYEEVERILLTIRKFINRLRAFSASIFHYAVSNIGNKCAQPEFHLYHVHLELRWLLLILVYTRTIKCHSSESSSSVDEFDKTLEFIIDDLIYISHKIFERISISDLRIKNPYTCTCVKEFWLVIQILVDYIHDQMKLKSFWEYVNSSLEKLPKQKNELFNIWMIYYLAILQGYDKTFHFIGPSSSRITANYDIIDKTLKSFSSDIIKEGIRDDLDEELKAIIFFLKTLSLEWWSFKVMTINYLWECFHRRLDQPFLMQFSGLWAVSLDKKSPNDILKQVKDRIYGAADQNESSYSMFLRFLGTILLKNDKNDGKYWHQIKGRICSKFTKAKVAEFGESALVNFISLFLTLAVTTDAANVCSIMLNLLPRIQEIDQKDCEIQTKKCLLNWKAQLAVLIIYSENKLNFEKIADKLIEVINLVSCRKDELARNMMINYVDTLNFVLNSSEKLTCGEYYMVGGWVDRYLLECPKNKIGPILKMLGDVFIKAVNVLSNSNGNMNNLNINPTTKNIGATKMLENLWSFVAGRIRTMVFDSNLTGDNFQEVARLAATFTIEACRNPSMASTFRHSSTSLFQHFTSTINVKDPRIIKFYIFNILSRTDVVDHFKKSIKNFNLLVIQAWIKCCIHGQDSDDIEMKLIKGFLLQLNDFTQVFNNTAEYEEFLNKKDSILMYLMASTKKRTGLKDAEASAYDAQIRSMFNNLDKWILLPIKEETKDSELAFWIYRCIGTIFLCCSGMLHSKSQNSMLKNFINKFILPLNDQLSYLKHLGKRIFSMIILGLESASAKSDITLKNLVHEIFQTYIPLLVTENTEGISSFKFSESLVRCFTDAQPEFVGFIIEILSSGFVKISGDNSMHKHSYLVMALLNMLLSINSNNMLNTNGYVNSQKNCNSKMITEFIILKCTNNIMEAYIKVHELHPHKAATINFIKSIVANYYYKNDIFLREKFQNTISSVLTNHLLSQSQAILKFMKSVIVIDTEIVKFIVPNIETSIKQLENYRPTAGSLRYLMSQLQELTKNNHTTVMEP